MKKNKKIVENENAKLKLKSKFVFINWNMKGTKWKQWKQWNTDSARIWIWCIFRIIIRSINISEVFIRVSCRVYYARMHYSSTVTIIVARQHMNFNPFRCDFGGKIKNFQRESRIIPKIEKFANYMAKIKLDELLRQRQQNGRSGKEIREWRQTLRVANIVKSCVCETILCQLDSLEHHVTTTMICLFHLICHFSAWIPGV